LAPKVKNNAGIVVVLVVVFGLFAIGTTGLYILSGLRAYVNAEALWSTGQKEATSQLIQYVFTREESNYQAFQDNLKVTLGYKVARLQLQSENPDDSIASEGFADGGNHPDDIPKMIFLFKHFQWVDHFKEAVKQWERADSQIERFLEVGKETHHLITNDRLSQKESARILATIETLQQNVTSAEVNFSHHISETTRWVLKMFFGMMLAFTVVGSLVCFVMIRIIAGIGNKLIRSQERLELIIKGSNDAPWDWDLKKDELWYSPQWWKQIGFDPGELHVDSDLWRKRLHPDDVPKIDAFFEEAVKNIDTYEIEFRLQHKEGHYVPVLSRGIITRNRAGQPIRVTGTNMDLSDQKKAQKDLFDSEQRYRRLTENAPDMIYRMSLKTGNYEYVSPSSERIFGYKPQDFYDSPMLVKNVLHPDWNNYFKEQWALLQSGMAPPSYEYQIIDKSGETRWIFQRNVLVKDKSGDPLAIEGIVSDITARKNAEQEKARLEEQLLQSRKMEAIGTLAGGIAHDFNNILSVIIGYAELALEDAPADSDSAGYVVQILNAGFRATDLVTQILAFSRQAKTERIPLQLQSLIKEMLKMLRASIPTTIHIEHDIDSTCGVVLADPTQVHQILMNLCTNANHAMEETGGTLTINLQSIQIRKNGQSKINLKPGSYALLSISDTGPGIRPDVIDKIFDPYFTTKEVGKGTGLGLAIAHGIITGYGGTIDVESEWGKGATVKVYFPVVEQEAMTTKEESMLPSGSGRVLFIDDEEILTQMGKILLERIGYSVTAFSSSLDALAAFQKAPGRFDVVITDQTMPEMTGFDLARRMLQIRSDVPIILCTGYSSIVDETSAKRVGIREFVLKPLTKEKIARILSEVLEKP